MSDPLLGQLTPDPHLGDCLLGKVQWNGRVFEVRIEHRGRDANASIALARAAVTAMASLESRAREVAADCLLREYNTSWRTFSRAGADGAMEECETAILKREVFAALLQILGLLVSPPSIEFEFDDDGMFAGHAVFVTAFDGVEFSNVQATLFG